MKKLFLLFALLLVALTACEQPTTDSTPQIETEGFIDGKYWEILAGTLTNVDDVVTPALIYRVDGDGEKVYDFWVSKLVSGDYWISVKVRNSVAFAKDAYDKVVFAGTFNLELTPSVEGTGLGMPEGNSSSNYAYGIQADLGPEWFSKLTAAGNIPVALWKGDDVLDTFFVSENFRKLLTTSF